MELVAMFEGAGGGNARLYALPRTLRLSRPQTGRPPNTAVVRQLGAQARLALLPLLPGLPGLALGVLRLLLLLLALTLLVRLLRVAGLARLALLLRRALLGHWTLLVLRPAWVQIH